MVSCKCNHTPLDRIGHRHVGRQVGVRSDGPTAPDTAAPPDSCGMPRCCRIIGSCGRSASAAGRPDSAAENSAEPRFALEAQFKEQRREHAPSCTPSISRKNSQGARTKKPRVDATGPELPVSGQRKPPFDAGRAGEPSRSAEEVSSVESVRGVRTGVGLGRPGCEGCNSACKDCWVDRENDLARLLGGWDELPPCARSSVLVLLDGFGRRAPG